MHEDEVNQIWLGEQAGDVMNLGLDLALPMRTQFSMLSSPSIYSSASDSSLHGNSELGHAWRMYVPDIGYGLDDLDLDGMIVDQNTDQTIIQSPEPMVRDIMMTQDLEGGGGTSQLQIMGVQTANNQLGFPLNMNQFVLIQGTELTEQSKYKLEALQQLCLLNEDKSVQLTDSNNDVTQVNEEKNHLNLKRSSCKEMGTIAKETEGLSQEALRAQIDRVMGRVEEAMAEMRERDDNKRVKRTIQTSSKEVKNLAQRLGENDTVDGMLVQDDAVVVFVSSDNSGESGDKKRKRRGKQVAQGGTIASRLKKKGDLGKKAAGTSAAPTLRLKKGKARMAVRKIKTSAIKPSTSLTLAPPTMGLPTP